MYFPDIHFLEIVELYRIFLRFNILQIFSSQISLFRRRKLVQLALDHVVLDLLEEQRRLADLMPGSDQIHSRISVFDLYASRLQAQTLFRAW